MKLILKSTSVIRNATSISNYLYNNITLPTFVPKDKPFEKKKLIILQ